MWWMDILDGRAAPKRGDLIHTNIGGRRERTWLVLRVRHMKRAKHPRRYKIWAARWWELEPEMRISLWRSSLRRGGQNIFYFKRYPVRKRETFEHYMARPLTWPVSVTK